ncbi:hypothetical protein H5410_057323 [Solanum commersonii]|uniref:NB-ARC domain-containing protein n=1 Tax=Solanum commersonii TaxID=4109 RepID=A0A9J5WPC4_SOLCO|nr:hypothetical protein H5410_057323 [Solanum commersonii]
MERKKYYLETINQQSDLNLCLSDEFFCNIKEKLEDTFVTLKDLQDQIGLLGLKEHFGSTKQETRTPSTSLVDESDIFGRHKGGNLTVVPIVGMGGGGKTTLAKVVYNDERVKNHFGLKAWFCVSESYDAFKITKGLLQEIGLTVDDNLNQLQIKLKERLNGKRFLVVHDDVWNDNYPEWDDLRSVFVQGNIGSKIIVTTRKESVALMMGSKAINVGTLSDEVSRDLFKRHSLDNRDPKEHPELEEIGKQIADKCKGLPLALKALAGILRCKSELDDNVLLIVQYIPKIINFAKTKLFTCGLPMIWYSSFIQLRSRSLFEMVSESSEWNSEKFLMHDLLNDLAQIASSNLCIRLEENKGSHMLEQCRHMSYSIGIDGDLEKLKSLFKSEQLRTLLVWRYTAVVTRNNLWLSKVLEQEMIPQQLGVLADILDIQDLFP